MLEAEMKVQGEVEFVVTSCSHVDCNEAIERQLVALGLSF